ncbi:Clr5 domain-containing protein, partial [Podospora aff. communis PSN243]
MATTSHQTAWAKPNDWEDVKLILERLYLTEGKKLREVKEEMEEKYSFKATNKMYTSRFTAWGWRNNLTSDEVLETLHLSNIPAEINAGQIQERIVARSHVQHSRLENYIRRNGKAKHRFLAGELPRGTIGALTHQARPTSGLSLIGPMQDTEDVLRCLKAYIDKCFFSGSWDTSPNGLSLDRQGGDTTGLIEIRCRFDTVTLLTLWDEDAPILHILDPAFLGLRTVIQRDMPLAFSFILANLLTLQRWNSEVLIGITLEFLCKSSRQILGNQHPLSGLWKAVSRLPFNGDVDPFEAVLLRPVSTL